MPTPPPVPPAPAGGRPPRPESLPPALAPDGATLRALCEETIARWHEAQPRLAGWDDAERLLPPRRQGAAGLAERIQLINAFQWHEEDRSRDQGADDATLAAVKRSIDASNGRRVRAVEAFDAHVVEALVAGGWLDPAAPLHSESPGSIVDRLTVLALKIWHVREELGGGAAPPAALVERFHSLQEQWDDLVGCLDRLWADLAGGRVRVKLYRQVKVYRDAASGRLRSGLE